VLYAVTVPPEGGDTEFANMIAAHDGLSDAERAELGTQTCVHSYAYSRSTNPGKMAPMSAEELAKVPDVTHPVLRSLPDGRRSVYLGTHASHIGGQPVEEGRARIRAMEEKLTALDNIYRHQWRQGDLLIWDNRSTLHRLTGYEIDKYARVMRRCTVVGTEGVSPAGN
jgi:taurine dioxygenase